jgi:DNA-binding transcriptional regulator YiaG
MKSGSKYFPLFQALQQSHQESFTLNIAEIEAILGVALPSSAHERGWWSNRENALQADAWMDAGYKVIAFDPIKQKVTFGKIKIQANYKIEVDESGAIAWDSELIKGLRQHMGLTQVQFAEELGIRQQTVSEWEQGIYTPTRASAKYLMLVAEKAGFYKTKS